jgi:2-polyprenyl-3-methyl-5-hydroxy-6-metoxy-1,4-benzoquinol methylase
MKKSMICDYTDYDYKSEFWTNHNRKYEHLSEITTVDDLLKKHTSKKQTVLDAGCGFGRLFDSYKNHFNEYFLLDYASNLIDEAKENLKMVSSITYFQQSLYDLQLPRQVDAIISVRTLHHLNNLETLFKNFFNHLSHGGLLVLDIPNYYHLKNKLKQPFLKKQPMHALSPTFYNYNPNFVIEKLTKSGFNVIDKRQIGLFRVNAIKKIISSKTLVHIESWLNRWISHINLAPSVYIVAEKNVDKIVDN